jgi:DNA-binding NarL/FixJ family response regulator
MANTGCVVLLGDFSNERIDLTSVVHDFGWSVSQASSLSELAEIGRSRTVVAVLVQTGVLKMPLPEGLRAIRGVAPRGRIIVCHNVGQSHSRAAMIAAGAFGVLLSPLAQSEVRQSLGFVWASKITPAPHVTSSARKTQQAEARAQRVGAA